MVEYKRMSLPNIRNYNMIRDYTAQNGKKYLIQDNQGELIPKGQPYAGSPKKMWNLNGWQDEAGIFHIRLVGEDGNVGVVAFTREQLDDFHVSQPIPFKQTVRKIGGGGYKKRRLRKSTKRKRRISTKRKSTKKRRKSTKKRRKNTRRRRR